MRHIFALTLVHVVGKTDVHSAAIDEQGDSIDADMSQLFKPFRAYCARKEVC